MDDEVQICLASSKQAAELLELRRDFFMSELSDSGGNHGLRRESAGGSVAAFALAAQSSNKPFNSVAFFHIFPRLLPRDVDDAPGSRRVPMKSFHGRHEISLKPIEGLIDRVETRGTAMNTIVATVLKTTAKGAQANVRSFNAVALFCGLGLLASLCLAVLGVDVSGAIF